MMRTGDDAYQQSLDYLYDRLPMFSRIGAAAIKKDLSNTLALCAVLGHPERRLRCVHIAGSNGKGSTSHMLAAIFQQAGYCTGLYTSPHLTDFRERIRINGAMVPKEFVQQFVAAHRGDIERIRPSFFEITVAMAFAAFEEFGVDIAIIETGLGGRLDSTNVVTPDLSVITNISLEHTDLLGSTIAEIASEKAGIIKTGKPVVVGESDPGAMPVFLKKAQDEDAPLYEAEQQWLVRHHNDGFEARHLPEGGVAMLDCPLQGSFQQANIATVLTAVDVLRTQGWQLPEQAVTQGLREVKSLTGLRGRWDVWQRQPFIVADVAHNAAGLELVMRDFANVPGAAKHVLVGFVRDKDLRAILPLLHGDHTLHFCAAQVPRALPAAELAQLAAEYGLYGNAYNKVQEAIQALLHGLGPEDALLITGSFFVVGEATEAYEQCMPQAKRPEAM
jgi:dihydrofolate synthase/folylpolyglutamate synthase